MGRLRKERRKRSKWRDVEGDWGSKGHHGLSPKSGNVAFFFHRTIGKYLEIIFIAKLLLILLLRFHCDVLPHKYKAHPVLLDIWKKNGYKPGIEVHACNPTPFENLRTALAREWIYVSKKKLKEKNRLQLNFSLNTVWTQDIQAKRKHFFLFNCSILSIPAYPPRKLPTP